MTPMKQTGALLKRDAFTVPEALLVILILSILLALGVATRNQQRQRSLHITCQNNLKQVGLAFKQWSLDSSPDYCYQQHTNGGGTKEYIETGEVFRHFQAMSNELNTPKVLNCPADERSPAGDFQTGFSNTNLSYFVGVDASDVEPQMFLTGDRNLTNGPLLPNGLLVVTTNSAVGWTPELHRLKGNIGLADGSVQHLDTSQLRKALSNMGGYGTNRLAIP